MASSKMKGSCTAAQEVSEIDDLVLQILHRLPLKSLGKFKAVSKRWLSLIVNSSSQIINPRPVRALLLQYYNIEDPNPDLDLLPLQHNEEEEEEEGVPRRHAYVSLRCFQNHGDNHQLESGGFAVLRSVNGLLLCGRTVRSRGFWNTFTMDYYVYNPLTHQHANLPNLAGGHAHVAASLVYEPSKSPHYKVVVLCKTTTGLDGPIIRTVMIYSSSSETRSWRRWDDTSFGPGLSEVGKCYDIDPINNGVFWNGSIYYISYGRMRWRRNMVNNLHRFDTESETMVRAHLPKDGRCYVRLLTASWGRLYLMVASKTRRTAGEDQFNVYEMENNNEWRVKYELNSRFDWGDIELNFINDLTIQMPARQTQPYLRVCQLFFSPPPDDDELWLALSKRGRVLCCNERSRKVTVARARAWDDIDHNQRKRSMMMAHEFMHSILDLP